MQDNHQTPTSVDPLELARRDQRKALPRRFYKEAGVREQDGLFQLVLDGRAAQTPGRNAIAVPHREAAEALAAEWAAQTEVIDPATMPLTRIVYSALDAVSREMAGVRAEIVKYAGSDLLCYRAGEPQSLVAAQAQAWDPVLDWARDELQARFILSEGIVFAAQPEPAIEAIRSAVAQIDSPLALAGLQVMTSLTGSALLALAVKRGRLTPAQAWEAAHVDEDFQIRAWGEDAEAMARRDRRWSEMQAAARLVAAG